MNTHIHDHYAAAALSGILAAITRHPSTDAVARYASLAHDIAANMTAQRPAPELLPLDRVHIRAHLSASISELRTIAADLDGDGYDRTAQKLTDVFERIEYVLAMVPV